MSQETTMEDATQETAAYIEVVMPDGTRSTIDLLKMHVDAINAETQEGDEPADAVLRLIDKGISAESYAQRMYCAAKIGA